jgi:hypothetical protein
LEFVISGNLFTRDYLLDGIERTAQWKSLPDKSVEALRHRLETIARNFLKIARPNEAETEKIVPLMPGGMVETCKLKKNPRERILIARMSK